MKSSLPKACKISSGITLSDIPEACVLPNFEQVLPGINPKTWHIVCVDNSGSMATNDGCVLHHSGCGVKHVRRWVEVTDALSFINDLTLGHELNTTLYILNKLDGIPQTVDIKTSTQHYIEAILKSSPTGATPLCALIKKIIQDIINKITHEPDFCDKIVITVLVDGESDDGDISLAMRNFLTLAKPVSVVVRLCTDNKDICDYWNKIDENLELPVDVIDDLHKEANQVFKCNPEFVYTDALHKARTFGDLPITFDLLDEQPLSMNQLHVIMMFIFPEIQGNPDPFLDPTGYVNFLSSIRIPTVYDVRLNKMMPCINIKALERKIQTENCIPFVKTRHVAVDLPPIYDQVLMFYNGLPKQYQNVIIGIIAVIMVRIFL